MSPLNKKRENKLRREKERGQIKNGSSTHRNVKWWNLNLNLHQKMIHIDVIKKNNALIKSTIICIIYEFKMKKLPKKLSSRSCWIIAAINRTFDLVCSLPLAFSRPIADKSIKSFLTRSQKSVRLCSACVVFCWHLIWFMWNYLFDWNHQTNSSYETHNCAEKRSIPNNDFLLHSGDNFMEIVSCHIKSNLLCLHMKGASELSKHIITMKL